MKFCYNDSKNNDSLKVPGRKDFFMHRDIWRVFQTRSGEPERTGAVEQEIIQGLFYLKKCIMALREARQLPPLLPLCQRLVNAGISCRVMLSEELLPERGESGEMSCPEGRTAPGKNPHPARSAAVAETHPGAGERQTQRAECQEVKSTRGILYLTDDPQVYEMLASAYPSGSSGGPPVLVYLHPGNGDADFGDARYALEEPEETEPEYLERVYRRCHNLPWEILVTKRCWLRETVEADVDSFWQMYQDVEITRYTQRLYPTLEAEREYVREYRRLVYAFYEFGVWTVLDRQSGAVVGRAGLSVREGYDLPELGFVIHQEWQGRGIAGEVCREILQYARESLGFEQIQALVHEENAVSLHLCRKLGFREQPVPGAAGATQDKPSIPASCLVEMEQNGQQARFVYMVYKAGGYDPADG